MTFLECAWAFVRWWGSTLLLALALWPAAFQLLKRLPDRGWAFARMIGILAAGYFFWLGCWLRLWPNVPGAAWLCAAVLFVLGTVLAGRRGETPWRWLRVHWREALFTEGVFLALFAALSWIRAYDAGATHTERPMDLAFLNAVMRSQYFPPHDPWLAGYAISYYHFGYILTGMLAKMSGLPGSVAFSFGVSGSFAMAGLGAYGLLRNLLILKADAAERKPPEPQPDESAAGWRKKPGFWTSHFLWAPLLAPFALLFLGNFEGSLEILYAQHVGWEDGQGAFWKALDISALNVPPLGQKSQTPVRNSWWWWMASRVINDRYPSGESVYNDGVIDEFPAFSFVIGDMHPHVMALPFLLLAVAVVLETLLRGMGVSPGPPSDQGLFLAFSSLSIGSFLFLNTWDVLVFGMAAAAGWVGWRLGRKDFSFGPLSGWKAFAARWALTGVLAVALFVPFLIGFSSQAGGIIPNVLFPTKGGQFFVMFGTLLVPIAAWLILELQSRGWKPDWRNGLLLAGGGMVLLLAGSLVLAFFISLNQDAMSLLQGALGESGVIEGISIALQQRLSDPFATLAPVALIMAALSVMLAWLRKKPSPTSDGGDSGSRIAAPGGADVFVLILVFWGALMVLFPEYFYLRDFFAGTRINTVFKFYFQGWAFLSLAAAYGIHRLFRQVLDRTEKNTARWAYAAVGSVVVLAVMLLGSVYFPLAVKTKTGNEQYPDEPTLDGSAFLQFSHPDDAAAISWILANITDDGPFVEAVGDDYNEYAARVATHTGIPSMIGWTFHEAQWRGGYALFDTRSGEIEELYRTTDWTRAQEILEKYGIRYVYFGPLEEVSYGIRGLDKFYIHLNVIYQSERVVIFERAAP
jgi:YYY domain-containing protein